MRETRINQGKVCKSCRFSVSIVFYYFSKFLLSLEVSHFHVYFLHMGFVNLQRRIPLVLGKKSTNCTCSEYSNLFFLTHGEFFSACVTKPKADTETLLSRVIISKN